MRRNLILIFSILLLLLLFGIVNVNAESIECRYDDVDLTITYDLDKPFDVGSNMFNIGANPFIKKGNYNSEKIPIWFGFIRAGKSLSNTDHTEIDQNLYKEVLGNYGCPSQMYVCTYLEISLDRPNLPADLIESVWSKIFAKDWKALDGWLNFYSEVSIMTDKEYRDSDYSHYESGKWYEHLYIYGIDFENGLWENVWDFIKADTGWGHEDRVAYKQSACQLTEYEGHYTAININCALLKNKLLADVKAIAAYKDCGSDVSCKRNAATKVKEEEENVKIQCKSILKNYNYTGGEAECIDECLGIKETLNEMKKNTDLYENLIDSSNNDCGFSQRLVTWILNIFKWVKYILPVVVIILGILDFIKAIGSDKEDEMKKAQKGFVIRLIAAALVFIVPLILEFILIKMGFGYDSCGLF